MMILTIIIKLAAIGKGGVDVDVDDVDDVDHHHDHGGGSHREGGRLRSLSLGSLWNGSSVATATHSSSSSLSRHYHRQSSSL